MARKSRDSNDLLLTEAQRVPPPHDVTVPESSAQPQPGETDRIDPDVLRDLKHLAERVGGLERLKEVVDILIRFPR